MLVGIVLKKVLGKAFEKYKEIWNKSIEPILAFSLNNYRKYNGLFSDNYDKDIQTNDLEKILSVLLLAKIKTDNQNEQNERQYDLDKPCMEIIKSERTLELQTDPGKKHKKVKKVVVGDAEFTNLVDNDEEYLQLYNKILSLRAEVEKKKSPNRSSNSKDLRAEPEAKPFDPDTKIIRKQLYDQYNATWNTIAGYLTDKYKDFFDEQNPYAQFDYGYDDYKKICSILLISTISDQDVSRDTKIKYIEKIIAGEKLPLFPTPKNIKIGDESIIIGKIQVDAYNYLNNILNTPKQQTAKKASREHKPNENPSRKKNNNNSSKHNYSIKDLKENFDKYTPKFNEHPFDWIKMKMRKFQIFGFFRENKEDEIKQKIERYANDEKTGNADKSTSNPILSLQKFLNKTNDQQSATQTTNNHLNNKENDSVQSRDFCNFDSNNFQQFQEISSQDSTKTNQTSEVKNKEENTEPNGKKKSFRL